MNDRVKGKEGKVMSFILSAGWRTTHNEGALVNRVATCGTVPTIIRCATGCECSCESIHESSAGKNQDKRTIPRDKDKKQGYEDVGFLVW